jgi:VanZ family protein
MSLQRGGFRWLPVILVMGVLFYQSHQPGNSFSLPDIDHIDKLLHGLAYMGLGLTFLYALPLQWRQRYPLLARVAAVLFCMCYGASDEFHQSFIPGRCASVADLAADVGGGVLAVLSELGWRHWRTTRSIREVPHEPSRSE